MRLSFQALFKSSKTRNVFSLFKDKYWLFCYQKELTKGGRNLVSSSEKYFIDCFNSEIIMRKKCIYCVHALPYITILKPRPLYTFLSTQIQNISLKILLLKDSLSNIVKFVFLVVSDLKWNIRQSPILVRTNTTRYI